MEVLGWRRLWAKTSDVNWLSLGDHLLDTVAVAEILWQRWVAPAVKVQLATALGGADDSEARALAVWLAGLHDLGKATPAFQVQVADLAAGVRESGLPITEQPMDRSIAPHAYAGGVLVADLLVTRGWRRSDALRLATIISAHHGFFSQPGISERLRHPDQYGAEPWLNASTELFDLVTDRSGAAPFLDRWVNLDLGRPVELTITGFVVLCDWVASNEAVRSLPSGAFSEHLALTGDPLTTMGWRDTWKPGNLPDNLLAKRFHFAPRPLQSAVVEVAMSVSEPGVLVVEAPMGEGKTEAALAAIEVLAQRFGTVGAYIALPTQASSDQMFGRVSAWLQHLPDGPHQLVLAHGKADLNPLVRHIDVSDMGRDDLDRVDLPTWFRGRGRQLLSPFAVGTVDHLLLAATRTRHVSLRHLGLAGKVVVVDEVHAYDTYMQVFLQRILAWLGANGVPVILLSATLPARLRTSLLDAYTGHESGNIDHGYPVISTGGRRSEVAALHVPSAVSATAEIEFIDEREGDEGLADAIFSRIEDGGCALLIRNTVARAQRSFRYLEQRMPGEVTLVHARFTDGDRERLMQQLVLRFGPTGSRPDRHVVVATQVVEQSLDVDFDLLASDLAPIDLLLQRLGRVHRHDWRSRPSNVRTARLLVGGCAYPVGSAPSPVRGSEAVYGNHLLLRTAAWLRERTMIALPSDIPLAVNAVYEHEDLPIPPAWMDTAAAARVEHEHRLATAADRASKYALLLPTQMRDLSLLGYAHSGAGEDDNAHIVAAVRDGDPSYEILLLDTRDGKRVTSDGCTVQSPIDRPTALSLRRSIIRVGRVAFPALQALTTLEAAGLPRQLSDLPCMILVEGRGVFGNLRFTYDQTMGLEVEHDR